MSASGAATLSSALAVTGNTTVGGTLGVTGVITGIGSGLTGLPAANLSGAVAVANGGTGNTSLAYTTLTDGATITWTIAGVTNNAVVTLGGNRTLAFSGLTSGITGTLVVKQDAAGSRTLTLPTSGCINKVIGGGGGAVTLTTTANAIDILTFTYDGTNCYWTYGANYN